MCTMVYTIETLFGICVDGTQCNYILIPYLGSIINV